MRPCYVKFQTTGKIKKCQISVHVVLVSNRSYKMVSAQPKQFENDFLENNASSLAAFSWFPNNYNHRKLSGILFPRK